MEKSNKTRLGNGVDQPRHQRSNSREFQKERMGGAAESMPAALLEPYLSVFMPHDVPPVQTVGLTV